MYFWDVNAARFLDPGAGWTDATVRAAGRTAVRATADTARTGNASRWGRYVALGDSFTAGIGDPEPRSPGGFRGWADRVAEELSEGHGDFGYANLAVSGLVIRQILEQQLGPAIELKPDLVTLSAGGNDLVFHWSDLDRLAASLDDAVGLLTATGATIVLFTGPDWGDTPLFGHIRGRVAVFNENLRTIAARHGAVIADLWTLRQLTDPQMWDPDRLHFSPMGHHTIAAMVLDALNVPHGLQPLRPKPLPSGGWRENRAGDLLWVTNHLLPWAINQIRPGVDDVPRTAKRPQPGPVAASLGTSTPPLVQPRSVG